MNKNSPTFNESKDMIANALFNLLEKKEISKISISELTEKALLARRTFYKHFQSKEDVIHYHLMQINDKYLLALKRHPVRGTYEYGVFFFSFFQKYSKELTILNKQGLLFSSTYDMYMMFMKENNHIVEELRMTNTSYNIAYRFGGIFFMLIEWIKQGCKESVHDMAKLLDLEIIPV